MPDHIEPTAFADVDALIAALRAELQTILGDKLVGLYVFGSLATGAFERATSDVDLVAALTSDLDQAQCERLARMHSGIARQFPDWDDRVEVGYLALDKLRRLRPGDTFALISPGEPFHVKAAENDWRFNLYILREHGFAVVGPPPDTLIDPISAEDLQGWLRPMMQEWRDWLGETDLIHRRTYQGHMIITMCRNLYLFHNGRIASKRQATAWAMHALPQWAWLIRDALGWREAARDAPVDGDVTLPQTLRFVHFAIDAIVGDRTRPDRTAEDSPPETRGGASSC
jgi:predicted nucleotidyltransferase